MALNSHSAKVILDGIFDKDRMQLLCGRHQYLGEGPPREGCVDCWKVFYLKLLQGTPPHLRRERLEELHTIVSHMNEEADRGQFDFQAFPHARVKIEKES